MGTVVGSALRGGRYVGWMAVVCLVCAAGCGKGSSAPDGAVLGDGGVTVWPAGALTQATMTSTVGVLLDEFPMAERAAIATQLIAEPAAFWVDRAKRQAALTGYRLVFRVNYYPVDPMDPNAVAKDSLPIAPDTNWNITLAGAPTRQTVGTHDVVALDYTLAATIVSDATSVGVSEPALANVGGTWDEPFNFPVDPELLLQRTGYACINEGEFPPNSVDSEEIDSMYDQECDVEPMMSRTGCHLTALPTMSCVDALTTYVGRIDTKVHFERLAYDPVAAAKVRIGPVTTTTGADMTGIPSQFQVNRTIYRYIAPDSCTLVEQCVGGAGWRRLLQFTGSDKNVGALPLDIGAIDYFMSGTVASQLIAHGVYEWSSCHQHYHFMHYGTFSYGDDPATNAKRGFCLQSTNRFTNNEYGSLNNPYYDCGYQGVGPGWGDEYRAGLECQWIDVTTQDTSAGPLTKQLQFVANPDGFLCEGTPDLASDGSLQFTPTNFKTATGMKVDKPLCNYTPNWAANNTDAYEATIPGDGEGYVTAACTHGQTGPLRNCEFKKAPVASQLLKCTPGASIKLSCTVAANSATQVVRACQYSAVLKTGVPCTYQDALANALVQSSAPTVVSATCPAALDANEPGGTLSIYQGPSFNGDAPADITCVVQ